MPTVAPPLSPAEYKRQAEEKLNSMVATKVKEGLVPIETAIQEQRALLDKLATWFDAQSSADRKVQLPGSAEEKRKDGGTFNFSHVVASLATGRRRGFYDGGYFDASMEWEMHDELVRAGMRGTPSNAQAANETETGAGGGFLVPGQVLTSLFIPLLQPRVIAYELGAQKANFDTFPVEIPKELTTITAGGAQENAALAESEQTFAMMSLKPHACGTFSKVSSRFLTFGADADTILRTAIAKAISKTWNQWYLKGTGIDDQPNGIFGLAGNTVTTWTDNAAAYANYLAMTAMEEAIALDDAETTNAKWAVPIKFVRLARTVKSENPSAGTEKGEVARQVVADAVAKTIIGYPYIATSQLSSGSEAEVILGDFTQSVLATFGPMVVRASDVANDALQKRQTHIAAWLDVDVGVFQPNAFCVSSGLDLSTF